MLVRIPVNDLENDPWMDLNDNIDEGDDAIDSQYVNDGLALHVLLDLPLNRQRNCCLPLPYGTLIYKDSADFCVCRQFYNH